VPPAERQGEEEVMAKKTARDALADYYGIAQDTKQ
jgi:hypothetical protein